MFENLMEVSLLYDFYGKLLSNRQAEAMRLYHEENLSLGEIAEEFDISRQAVYDALKSAEKTLKSYEEKLNLVESFQNRERLISEIRKELHMLNNDGNKEVSQKVFKIEKLLNEVEL